MIKPWTTEVASVLCSFRGAGHTSSSPRISLNLSHPQPYSYPFVNIWATFPNELPVAAFSFLQALVKRHRKPYFQFERHTLW